MFSRQRLAISLLAFVLAMAAITSPAYKEITTLQTTHLFVFDDATLLAENLHADTLKTIPVWTYFGIALCLVAWHSTSDRTTLAPIILATMGRVVLFLVMFYRQMEARSASLEATTSVTQPVYSMLFIVIVMLLPLGLPFVEQFTPLKSGYKYVNPTYASNEAETLFKL